VTSNDSNKQSNQSENPRVGDLVCRGCRSSGSTPLPRVPLRPPFSFAALFAFLFNN
jgi:hypothetical protein